MLRSIGKQCANILFGVSRREQNEGYVGKDLPKREVSTLKWKSEGVKDDKSGEPRQRLPACRRPRHAAAPALGINTHSRRSSIAAVHCRRPCLSRGRVASVEQSARFRHGVNVAAHVQATPEDCTVREKATEHWLFPTTWTPSIARHFICV